MLLNDLLVLVAPNFRNRLRGNFKRKTECFSEEFLHVCEEEDGTLSVYRQKFIYLTAAIDRFFR